MILAESTGLRHATVLAPLVRALTRLLARVQSTDAAPPPPPPAPAPTPPISPSEPADLVRAYFRAKSERGGAAFQAALGLAEAELGAFEAALRDVERTSRRCAEPAPSATDERNAVIADVRILTWLETISARIGVSLADEGVEALVSLDVGRKQVRAIELLVRALILESHVDQARLFAHLTSVLGERVVRGFTAKASGGDLLSGCTFGELSSLFVGREEFARYERLYADTPFLTLLKERRRTMQAFLDDVRRVRNALAHEKQVSKTQLTLLDLQYEELSSPVQTAFDQGATKVDPSALIEVGREELDRHTASLQEDVAAVRDDLASLRASLEGAIGAVAADTTAIRRTTRGIDRKVGLVLAGVAALLVGGYFVWRQGGDTKDEATRAKDAGERAESASHDAASEARAAKDAAGKTETAARDAQAASKAAAELAAATKAAAERTEAAQKAEAERAAAAARATEAAAREAAAASKASAASTEKVARTLESLRAGFDALVKQGGTIADADRPEAHYHNARVYEQRGDVALAMAAYRRYFASAGDLGFLDPHLRFQALLRLQGGPGGAREAYDEVRRSTKSPIAEFAAALLLEGDARTAAIDAYVAAHPDFAPGVYEASRDVSAMRVGTQGLEDKRLEKERLEKFLALTTSGAFLAHYLDPSVAAAAVDDARARLAPLATLDAGVFEHPVSLTTMRSNLGWNAMFQIAEPVREIFWRAGSTGEFTSTGVQDGLKGQNGLPLAKSYVDLGMSPPKQTIEVKYLDVRGRMRGPFALAFDPDAQALVQEKSILTMTRNGWLMFRDYEGKLLLYFTQLVSYRGSLLEIRYGLDKDEPDTVFPISKADPKNPNAIGENDVLYLSVPLTTKFATVRLTYRDGTRSDVVRFNR